VPLQLKGDVHHVAFRIEGAQMILDVGCT